MSDIRPNISDRDLQPYHSFMSSFFAGFAELGLVNQGSLNIVSRRAAEYFHAYLDAKGILPAIEDVPGDTQEQVIRNLILYSNKLLNLMAKYDLRLADESTVVLEISSQQCRICPKGVGGAAVKGTLCPIPSFLESLINLIAGKEYLRLDSRGLVKQDDLCLAYYKILQ